MTSLSSVPRTNSISFSKFWTHSIRESGGRYNVHINIDLDFGILSSIQILSTSPNSRSFLLMYSSESCMYNNRPPPFDLVL